MNEHEKACEFEALICEVQSVATIVEAMKTKNREREFMEKKPLFNFADFDAASKKMIEFAAKFRDLAKR
jgi:hypothetical protein